MSELEESNNTCAESSSEENQTLSDAGDATDTETVCSQDATSDIDNARLRIFDSTISADPSDSIQIPIVGYEVMEERAKFTVFKLKVEHKNSEDIWFVFRRYTDFVRLHTKLKEDHPDIQLFLPKKKWFGDNFNPNFLDERIEGLQRFIDSIIKHKDLVLDVNVRDFFCLDEPPSLVDNVEESKAVVEALEEQIYHLKRQLQEKVTAYEKLKAAHSVEIAAKLRLVGFIQECTTECPSCANRLSQLGRMV